MSVCIFHCLCFVLSVSGSIIWPPVLFAVWAVCTKNDIQTDLVHMGWAHEKRHWDRFRAQGL